MSMEERITTLEEVSQLVITALRAFNDAMRRYEAAAARREEAMRRYEAAAARREEAVRQAVRQYEAAAARSEEATRELAGTMERSEEQTQELADAMERQNEAVQALMAFVPVTQAEIVRLDSRIDRIDGA